MGKSRFDQVSSEEDDEERKGSKEEEEEEEEKDEGVEKEGGRRRRRNPRAIHRDENEDEEGGDRRGTIAKKKNKKGDVGKEEEEEQEEGEDAKPVGDVIKITGEGRRRKNHYASFEYDGNVFELEESVLVSPKHKGQKPDVAIIKDITQDMSGNMMVTGQWFYRPEEVGQVGGWNWQARDTQELFYSFHQDDVPAESVMQKCVVHFVPLNKQLPVHNQHPGFIVQKVYDTVEKKLWKSTDKDYEDNKQHKIDLVQKTLQRLGELPDVKDEDVSTQRDDPSKSKCNLQRKSVLPIDASGDDAITKSEQLAKAQTPGSCTGDVSEYRSILAKFKALTSDYYRDKWLEKLLQGVQPVCNSEEETPLMDDQKNGGVSDNQQTNASTLISVTVAGSKESDSNEGDMFCWPDAAIRAITDLERMTHEALGTDFHTYNQKMRQLDLNLKNNALLARRLLAKELEPLLILTMSPNELKDGLTAEEKTTKEPEKFEEMQMTDAIYSRCKKKRVGAADIIEAGGLGDRYQLECISSLTMDAPNVAGTLGTTPWATAKFENVEKKLVSPCDAQKLAADIFQKSIAAYMPALGKQTSFSKSKTDVQSASAASNHHVNDEDEAVVNPTTSDHVSDEDDYGSDVEYFSWEWPEGVEYPPGVKFLPKDSELINDYLKLKVRGDQLPCNPQPVKECNIYNENPEELLGQKRDYGEEDAWYFFTLRKKSKHTPRPDRSAKGGYWEITQGDGFIIEDGEVIGLKSYLVFYEGKQGEGRMTDWKMQEYRIPESNLDTVVLCKIYWKETIEEEEMLQLFEDLQQVHVADEMSGDDDI